MWTAIPSLMRRSTSSRDGGDLGSLHREGSERVPQVVEAELAQSCATIVLRPTQPLSCGIATVAPVATIPGSSPRRAWASVSSTHASAVRFVK
jgi:hypothetical protein